MGPWHLDPGHPNRLVPGKRVRHTMNPAMVFRGGELWAVLGTPGGDYQVQVNLQVLTAMIDLGYDPQQAAEMPRWSSTQPGQEANWPHACPDALNLEARFPTHVRTELADRGHPVVTLGELEGPCSVEIIRRDAATGMLAAGSDPRRDGWALAY
jgi:gamma-glutamyltranspeptidase/glutathione hydrolase